MTDGAAAYSVYTDAVTGSPSATLDAFIPKGACRAATILLIHGGGFRGGSRKSFHGWCRWFASRGYPAASIDYQLATRSAPSYPKPILDCWTAFDFVADGGLRGLAGGAHIPATPEIVVVGSSAGATLAATLNLGMLPAQTGVGEAGFRTRRPAGVVTSAGVFDFIQGWEHDQLHLPRNSSKEIYLGGDPMTHRSLYHFASPLFYASAERAHDTKWLFTWGTMDDVCDNDRQSSIMAVNVKRAGGKVRTMPVPGASHYWFPDKTETDDNSHASFVAPRILAFLREFELDGFA